MTRLCDDWLGTLESGLSAYENELRHKTGLDFAGIAAAANGLSPDIIREKAETHTIAIIPITSGQGVIGGFADAVAAILRLAGFCVFVTKSADIDGIYEAYSKGARLVFMADDCRYIGFDLNLRRVSDNNAATARGFVTALTAMCPSTLADKDVLVLGCGIIGRLAATALLEKNARPILYDKTSAAEDASRQMRIPYIRNAADIAGYQYILDATNEGDWLKNDMLHNNTYISAPGVPLSLDADALARHGERLVHDLLHIGTLAMLGELCKAEAPLYT